MVAHYARADDGVPGVVPDRSARRGGNSAATTMHPTNHQSAPASTGGLESPSGEPRRLSAAIRRNRHARARDDSQQRFADPQTPPMTVGLVSRSRPLSDGRTTTGPTAVSALARLSCSQQRPSMAMSSGGLVLGSRGGVAAPGLALTIQIGATRSSGVGSAGGSSVAKGFVRIGASATIEAIVWAVCGSLGGAHPDCAGRTIRAWGRHRQPAD